MNASNKLLDFVDSFGAQLFDDNGSISIWLLIIKSLNQLTIDRLLRITRNMSNEQQFVLAKRIITEGFDSVVNQIDCNTNENSENSNLIIDTSERDQSIDQQLMDSNDPFASEDEDDSQTADMINTSTDRLFTEFNVINDDSDDSNNDGSNKSFKTALTSSPAINKTPHNSLAMDIQSRTDNLNVDQFLESTSGLSGHILSFSPLTPHCSQKTSQSLSSPLPSPASPASSLHSCDSSPQKKVRRTVSPQNLKEMYGNSLAYDTYCSEKFYVNEIRSDSNSADSVLSPNLLLNIIEENTKI